MDGIGRPERLRTMVPDKENYRKAVCDVDRNVAHCFFLFRKQKNAGETALFGRKLCEDFAPRNEVARLSGEWGAKRTRRPPAKLRFPAGSCVKILLPGTKA